MKVDEFPLNDEIKIGMKVLVELIKNRGSGNLTEGIVKKKISFLNYDKHGILVILENNKEQELQGRVHKILDQNFIEKKSKEKQITLKYGDFLHNRIKIVGLLSDAEDFIWLHVGYFKHKHFDILREVFDNNKNIKEIKIITGLPFRKNNSVDNVEFEKIITYADATQKQYPDISINLKFLTDKKIGSKAHARLYFTKNQAWSFIDLDIMLRAQREFLSLQPEEELEENIENDFNYFWNQETTFSIFGDEKGILLQRISKINENAQV